MSNQKYEHERRFYTFMTLVGDFGGFQGAIVIFPAIFMSFYALKKFETSLLASAPIKKRRRNDERSQSDSLR